MVQTAGKNLWVAASDGDLERVKELIAQGASPNDKDSNAYTPMHAAASYAHLDLLDYLLSAGGDVNLPDDDGDTPLYTVETPEAARWLVEHSADAAHKNAEGMTPAQALAEDHPEIAAYLRGITGEAAPDAPPAEDANADATVPAQGEPVSQLAVDEYTSRQTNDLLAQTREIMEQAERDGVDPDERLREVVGRAVREGFAYGADSHDAGAPRGPDDTDPTKRSRAE